MTFTGSAAAGEIGFKVDHTADGNAAGCGGTIGDRHWRTAERSLRKLTAIMQSDVRPSTVELWALASVAKGVLVEREIDGYFMREEHDPRFLKAFAELIERQCEAQYTRELESERGRS